MALSADIGSTLEAKYGEVQSYTAGASIWRGATIVLRSNGQAYPAIEDIADTNKQVVVGIAQERSSLGNSIRVRQDGKWRRKFTGTPVVGRLACVKDDETCQPYGAGTGKVVVGRITEITGTDIYVDIKDRPSRLASGIYD